MPGGNEPCAFHNQSMEQLRETLLDIKEQMREGIKALHQQAAAFAESIARIMDSQTARRELCAKQAQRIETLEDNQMQHRTDHAKAREEHVQERAELWTAINKLRLYVYAGLGIGLLLQFIMPLIIAFWLKR